MIDIEKPRSKRNLLACFHQRPPPFNSGIDHRHLMKQFQFASKLVRIFFFFRQVRRGLLILNLRDMSLTDVPNYARSLHFSDNLK